MGFCTCVSHAFCIPCLAATNNLYSRRAYFSQSNGEVDIAAPGVSVISTVVGGGYAMSTGTSMATPHVTGAIARVWSVCRSCSAAQVEQCLLSTAFGNGSRTNDVGYGSVQTEDAYTCLVETVGCCTQETIRDTGDPVDEDSPEPVPTTPVPDEDSPEPVPEPTDQEPVSTCRRRKENERCRRDAHCCSQKCNLFLCSA
jgi:hypothetical protein